MNNIKTQKSVLSIASVKNWRQKTKISLEDAIRENDISTIMFILMREKNISMPKLLALSADDVNKNTCEIIIKRIVVILKENNFCIKPMRYFQKISISKKSMKLLTAEIQKHLISGNDNFIFTNNNGEFYKPLYYVEKFRELSKRVGFAVTPKNLNAIYKEILLTRNIDDYFAAYMEAFRCS